MTIPSKAGGKITLQKQDLCRRRNSHILDSTWSALLLAESKASLAMETSAASLPSEVKQCRGEQVIPESASVMLARPLRARKFMAIEGCLRTEDRGCLRGFPSSTSAELIMTDVFS